MDHFCIYLPPSGRCIGALNLKQFLQLLVYSWLGCAQAAQLAFRAAVTAAKPRRAMVTAAVVAALLTLWLSVLLCVQLHGIGAAAGAIDRLQGAPGQWQGAAAMPATLQNEVIGIGHWTKYVLPTKPQFADPQRVLGYKV
jgi:DHHC palmitoyltransferase